MNRRDFVLSSMGGTAAAALLGCKALAAQEGNDVRAMYPRVKEELYFNAAGMMPLSTFSQHGLQKYMAFQQLGPGDGRVEYVWEVQDNIGGLFAELIGAEKDEIGLVHCTKAGEQIALEAVDAIKSGGNIVTNDLHFGGSLNNLMGMKKAGRDVRVVRAKDWKIDLADMDAAIDEGTSLVAVTAVSNINGHVEDMAAIARMAHAKGALVYADIIQAAGIVPIDVRKLGVDIAACSCYKWLHGVHGTAFLYVAKHLQGTRIPDRLFPGYSRANYAPWVLDPNPEQGAYISQAKHDATRYQPGHVSYLGYCAAYEGLRFLNTIGVEKALSHSVRLNKRLRDGLDADLFPCITPDVSRSPLITFQVKDQDGIRRQLKEANVTASLSGGRLRISPGLYNTDMDVDLLLRTLSG